MYYDRQNMLLAVANVRQAPMAYDPGSGRFFVAGGLHPIWCRRLINPYIISVQHAPGSKEAGLVAALHARTHKLLWQQRSLWSLIASSGVMTTAGGLLFRAEGDGTVPAFDSRTGKRLWSFQTGSLPGPTVDTLTGGAPNASFELKGEQHVVAPMGRSVWAFTLRGTLAERPAPLAPPNEFGFQGIVGTLGPDDEIGLATLRPTRAPGALHFVDESSFTPARAQVPAGSAVRFTNYGIETHTIVASDGSWTAGPIAPG
jgi:hypothetical protein